MSRAMISILVENFLIIFFQNVSLQMHLQRESTLIKNVVKMLLILLISYNSYASAGEALSPEEIAQAILESAPERYCGKKSAPVIDYNDKK